MNLIKPKKLQQGDTIGILALSGAIESKENILNAKKYFENKGFKVVLSENIFDEHRYLAGTDEKKVEELHKFFKNPDINMILCARGGYGAIRLLDKIDFDLIKNNPKIFAGYSDVTAIEAMIYKKTGLVTFYAPMAQGDFGVKNVSKVVEDSFFDVLMNTVQSGDVEPPLLSPLPLGERKNAENIDECLKITPDKEKSKTYFAGEAQGTLWGGNLATLVSLCGLDFIPDEKFILFIEDLNEPVYKIDKMMQQLLNIDKFRENLAGIVLGDFLGIDLQSKLGLPTQQHKTENALNATQYNNKNEEYFDGLFFEIGEKIKKPIFSGFKITHATDKITIPYGVPAELSTATECLIVNGGYLL